MGTYPHCKCATEIEHTWLPETREHEKRTDGYCGLTIVIAASDELGSFRWCWKSLSHVSTKAES